MPEFVKAATVADVPPNSVRCVELKGLRLALYNINGTFYATQDYCTHADASLSDGCVEGSEIICPWHGARFDVTNGHATCGPAYGDLATYRVRVAGNDIEIEI